MRDDVKIVFLFKIKVEPSIISSLFGTSSIIIPCRLIEFYNLPSNSDVYENIVYQPFRYVVQM